MTSDFEKNRKARNALIMKQNDLIQKSSYYLSPTESKILNYCFSKITDEASVDKPFYIDCAQFSYLIQSRHKGYSWLKQDIKSLADKSWWHVEEDEENNGTRIELKRWLKNVSLVVPDKGRAFVQAEFDDSVKPYIRGLVVDGSAANGYFTSFQFQKIALMNLSYSQRLYELLMSYSYNRRSWEWDLGTGSRFDLMTMLCNRNRDNKPEVPSTWYSISKFQSRVLNPALEEIKKYTELDIEYSLYKTDMAGHKMSRPCRIRFVLQKKCKEDEAETEMEIEQSYIQFDQSIGLESGNAENRCEEQEEEPKVDAVKEKEDFSEEQLQYLLDIARLKINLEDKEKEQEIAERYLKYYRGKIKFSQTETKSSEFSRLKNLLKNDYDCIADLYKKQERELKENIKIDYDAMVYQELFNELEAAEDQIPGDEENETERQEVIDTEKKDN